MGITLDVLNEEIKCPVEIDKLNIFVRIVKTLRGKVFSKNERIPFVSALYFKNRLEIIFLISLGVVG